MQPGIVFISGDNLNNMNKKLTIFPFNYNYMPLTLFDQISAGGHQQRSLCTDHRQFKISVNDFRNSVR